MKRIVSVILMICIAVSAMSVTAVAAPAYEPRCAEYADALHGLGLLTGTGTNADGTPIYSLNKELSRAEIVVMILRLLGEEGEAKAYKGGSPFDDIKDSWAEKQIAYAYSKGYVNGTDKEGVFAPNMTADGRMFITLLLRVLGYDDTKGDFTYGGALNFAYSLGICEYDEFAGRPFYRDDCFYTSVNALKTNMNGYYSKTLLDTLVKKGVVDAEDAKNFKKASIEKADPLDYTVIDMVIGKSLSQLKAAFPGGEQDTNGTDIFYTFKYDGKYVTCKLTNGKCVSVEGHISLFVRGADNSLTRHQIALILGDAYGTGDFGNYYSANTTGFSTCIGNAGIFTCWQQTKYIKGWSFNYSVEDIYTSGEWQIGSMWQKWNASNGVFTAQLNITKASEEKLYADVSFAQLELARRIAETGTCTFHSFDGGKTYKASGVYDNWGNRINIIIEFINDAAMIEVETTKADQMANFCFNDRFVVFGTTGGNPPASF